MTVVLTQDQEEYWLKFRKEEYNRIKNLIDKAVDEDIIENLIKINKKYRKIELRSIGGVLIIGLVLGITLPIVNKNKSKKKANS